MKKHNERGAGRKKLPYETVVKRVPKELASEIDKLISTYKQGNKDESK